MLTRLCHFPSTKPISYLFVYLFACFYRFGEIVDVNLVRDKTSGASKGFAFIAYEDQRSTVLAVDNFNGAKVGVVGHEM